MKIIRTLRGYFIVAIKKEILANPKVSLKELGTKVTDCFMYEQNSEEGDIIWVNSY